MSEWIEGQYGILQCPACGGFKPGEEVGDLLNYGHWMGHHFTCGRNVYKEQNKTLQRVIAVQWIIIFALLGRIAGVW